MVVKLRLLVDFSMNDRSNPLVSSVYWGFTARTEGFILQNSKFKETSANLPKCSIFVCLYLQKMKICHQYFNANGFIPTFFQVFFINSLVVCWLASKKQWNPRSMKKNPQIWIIVTKKLNTKNKIKPQLDITKSGKSSENFMLEYSPQAQLKLKYRVLVNKNTKKSL